MPVKIFGPLDPQVVSRYFFYLALLNIVIAVAVTVPVLVPEWGLPLKVAIWPGTWMLVAYFSFIGAGVLGVLAWSVIYYLLPGLLAKQRVSRFLSLVHLTLFEASVVGATGLIGIFPGYIGGTLIHDGFGQFVVTRIIEWTVIPIGIMIFLALVATLTGILNVVVSK